MRVIKSLRNADANKICVLLYGEVLEEVQCFKYMGLQVDTELLEPEVNLRVREECNGLQDANDGCKKRFVGSCLKCGLRS